jgi:CRISPR system Cascade subunit CasC
LLKESVDAKMAEIAALKATGFGNSEGKEREKEMDTAQIMFISDKDIDAIVKVMKDAIATAKTPEQFKKIEAKELQKKIKGWRPITPDIALFGRMITSDAFEDVEASMQVAHAISTNKMDHEFDYFTAVDDLKKGGEEDSGAGMIGDVEFNSACYYKYFSLDFDDLVNNLAGPEPDEKALKEAKEIALITTKAFINAAIKTTPSGKQNTFAAHQLPDAVLIEMRKKNIPKLCQCFRETCSTKRQERPDGR